MSLKFWDRVNEEIKTQKTKQEWIAEKIGIKYQTFRSWISKNLLPRVDDAFRLATVLGVSVEYLMTGIHPRDLISPRFKNILIDLEELSDTELESIRLLANAYAERHRQQKRVWSFKIDNKLI